MWLKNANSGQYENKNIHFHENFSDDVNTDELLGSLRREETFVEV